MSKLKLLDPKISWEEAQTTWDDNAKVAAMQKPLKRLHTLPNIPGITPETKKFLKWKSIKYLLLQKRGLQIVKYILKHPFRYTKRYLASIRKPSYKREGDFFLYGINSIDAFKEKITQKEALILFGFSYCQKPFECPEGRFTKGCIANPNNLVCAQCDIGKVIHALPAKEGEERIIPVLIPTIHDIGEVIFELLEKYPKRPLFFVITACEMTLEMFGDFGNMVGIKGIGIRLDGRICNTMRAFELSEEGIKPGLTVLREPTQNTLLELVRTLYK